MSGYTTIDIMRRSPGYPGSMRNTRRRSTSHCKTARSSPSSRKSKNHELSVSHATHRNVLSQIIRMQFPKIAARLQHCIDEISLRWQVPAQPFRLPWNFCVNALVGKVKHVACRPHVDGQNRALLVSAVYIYYYGQGASPSTILLHIAHLEQATLPKMRRFRWSYGRQV